MTGTLHLRDVVAEADGVDQFAGVLVALRIESIDVADAAAHEKKDDRIGLFITGQTGVELAVFGPKRADGPAQKGADGLLKQVAARNQAARIKILVGHIY